MPEKSENGAINDKPVNEVENVDGNYQFCPNCENTIKSGELFCGYCGAALPKSQQEETTRQTNTEKSSDNINKGYGDKPEILSTFESIYLTKNYVYQKVSGWGESIFKCIFLKDISSIKLIYKSNPLFIFLAIVSVAIGAFINNNMDDSAIFIWSIIIAIIFMNIYFLTRKSEIEISAHNRQNIVQRLVNTDKYTAEAFIDRVIDAKSTILNKY